MRLRRTAVVVTATVAAVVIVVISAMTFMGMFGREVPARDDPMACVQKAIERYELDGRRATVEY